MLNEVFNIFNDLMPEINFSAKIFTNLKSNKLVDIDPNGSRYRYDVENNRLFIYHKDGDTEWFDEVLPEKNGTVYYIYDTNKHKLSDFIKEKATPTKTQYLIDKDTVIKLAKENLKNSIDKKEKDQKEKEILEQIDNLQKELEALRG